MATAEATESTREFSTDTKELGDRIVGLTLKAAKELSDYLDEVHGIEPATGGAVMVAAGAGAGGDGGGEAAAEKTEFDVVLESFGDNKISVIKVVRSVSRKPKILLREPLARLKKAFRKMTLKNSRRNLKRLEQKSRLSSFPAVSPFSCQAIGGLVG